MTLSTRVWKTTKSALRFYEIISTLTGIFRWLCFMIIAFFKTVNSLVTVDTQAVYNMNFATVHCLRMVDARKAGVILLSSERADSA